MRAIYLISMSILFDFDVARKSSLFHLLVVAVVVVAADPLDI